MTDDKTKSVPIEELLGKEIPADIYEQLQIAGRVRQFLKPTSVSAVSTSAQDRDAVPQALDDEIDTRIDDIVELENLVEQLEDMSDKLLADMSIPPINDRVADAAKEMGSEDGTITKDVFDNARATLELFPLMVMGQDPALAALVGDGTIDGDWVNCNEITQALSETFRTPPRNDYEADAVIADKQADIADKHEKRLAQIFLDMLLQLFWNMLWPKFIVDAAIINSLRLSIANPVDAIIGFFKKKRFKRKSKDWLSKNGPINKALNRLRNILICKIPPRMYEKYKPIVEIDCRNIDSDCPPEPPEIQRSVKNEKGSLAQMGEFMDDVSEPYCFTPEEFLEGIDDTKPTGLGASPTCAKAATIVLEAVVSDALTPPGAENDLGASTMKNIILNSAEDAGRAR